MNQTRIGMVGVGGIAKGVHIPGYQAAIGGKVTALCDISDIALDQGAEICSLDKSQCYTDYLDLIASEDVDAVDICTPNNLHCTIAEEAIRKGKPFSVEKPMGLSHAETARIHDLAQKAGVVGHVCFSWRYRPYIRYMKWLISQGVCGKLYHGYIRCIKDSGLWPGRKLEWRFDKKQAGTGVLGDLASHMYDLTRFITGEEFTGISAQTGIWIKSRQKLDSDDFAEVTTDDWCNALVDMRSGLNVTYQISRCATTIGDSVGIELYGSNGMLRYMNHSGQQTLEICSGEVDMTGQGSHFVVPPARFNASQSQAFINLVQDIDDGLSATLADGVICQKVIDATEKAAASKRWISISEEG